jgi:hypothetical protein
MSQTKQHSILESLVNVAIGYSIVLLSQLLIFPLYNVHLPIQDNIAIGIWFTVISLIRSYVLRRWFNKITIKAIKANV